MTGLHANERMQSACVSSILQGAADFSSVSALTQALLQLPSFLKGYWGCRNKGQNEGTELTDINFDHLDKAASVQIEHL